MDVRGRRRARFDRTQSASGLNAWEPVQVRSWNAWLESMWSSLVSRGEELRLLLNPAQEHTLWREIIAGSTAAPSLGSPDSLAELAQTAWRLAASYEATADIRRFAVAGSPTLPHKVTALRQLLRRGLFSRLRNSPAASGIANGLSETTIDPPVGFRRRHRHASLLTTSKHAAPSTTLPSETQDLARRYNRWPSGLIGRWVSATRCRSPNGPELWSPSSSRRQHSRRAQSPPPLSAFIGRPLPAMRSVVPNLGEEDASTQALSATS